MMYECSVCHQYARKTLVGVLRHIREVHPHFQAPVICGLDGCTATPSSYDGLKKHIYRAHRDHLGLSGSDGAVAVVQDSVDSDLPSGVDDHYFSTQFSPPSSTYPSSTYVGAEFLLKTRDGQKLTQVTADGIICDTKVILQNRVEAIERAVFKKIEDLGVVVTADEEAGLRTVFSDESLVNPFVGLETEYLQEKFIREHFNYVVSLYYYVDEYCMYIFFMGGSKGSVFLHEC